MNIKKIKLLGNDTKMQSLISNRYDALDKIFAKLEIKHKRYIALTTF